MFTTFALIFLIKNSYALRDFQLEKNKQQVIEVYDKTINQKDFEATSLYLVPRYTQT